MCLFFFFKQKTAYEMRISDWSSDVCSSDLLWPGVDPLPDADDGRAACRRTAVGSFADRARYGAVRGHRRARRCRLARRAEQPALLVCRRLAAALSGSADARGARPCREGEEIGRAHV